MKLVYSISVPVRNGFEFARPECMECGTNAEVVVQLGEGEESFYACFTCITAAMSLMCDVVT